LDLWRSKQINEEDKSPIDEVPDSSSLACAPPNSRLEPSQRALSAPVAVTAAAAVATFCKRGGREDVAAAVK
jgi:hypothetical protein